MTTITVDEIQQDPAAYLQRVKAGETLLVVEADLPIAEIKPVLSGGGEPRPYGLAAGEFSVPDDFDAPLPDDVLQGFEGR